MVSLYGHHAACRKFGVQIRMPGSFLESIGGSFFVSAEADAILGKPFTAIALRTCVKSLLG
jgi:hypothetical protein